MKKIMKNTVVDAVLLIVLGLVFLIKPGETLDIVLNIVGIMLLAMGAVKLVTFFAKKDRKERSASFLIVGIMQIVFGLLLIVRPGLFISIWYMAAAVLIGYGAIVSVICAIRQKKAKMPRAVITLVFAFFTLALAIVVFLNPAAFASFYTQLVGVSFVLEGFTLLFASIRSGE